ncbi:MFS transporter [Henriciella sp. AS95]|uniref:MFS transporter n=1 Tax=Henriciella sp. AS95 TaxID=3135782 RepID=UPI0031737CF4
MVDQDRRDSKLIRLVGYGIGDFGLNIYWNMLSIWLVYWYTDVVGLRPEMAGFLFLIAMVWDAISDPIVAGASERVRTRHGTYRPFLLFGSCALGLSFCFLFWVPPFEGPLLIMALIGITLIFRTTYTLVAVPYAAMSSRLSYDSVERTELSGVRMFFAFGGLLVVSFMVPSLARWFSNGSQYTAQGFQWVAILGAVLATVVILVCFLATREKPVPSKDANPPRTAREIWRNFRQNPALHMLLVVIFLQSGANASLMISLVYFIQANQDIFAAKEIVLSSFAIATIAGVPFWTILIRDMGKKLAWSLSSIAIVMCGLQMLVFGPFLIAGLPVQVIAYGFCSAAFPVLFWAFIPDTVEFGQIRSGVRSEGVAFGSVLIVQKISGGVMGVVVSQVLALLGYGASTNAQNTTIADGLTVFLAVCPPLMFALSMIPVWFLPINRKIHADIVGKLSSDAQEKDEGKAIS